MSTRASERNFFRGTKVDTGPTNVFKCLWAPNLRKIFFLIFCPKLGEEQKKRSSLTFSPIFCPKLGKEQKKRSLLKFSPINTPLGATPKLNAET